MGDNGKGLVVAKGTQVNGMARRVVQVGVILLAAAVVWGAVRHQVKDNTEDIAEVKECKLDKEVFKMYCEQQKTASEKTDTQLNRIEGKLDKALEK